MKKYKMGQREFSYAFIDMEKVYDSTKRGIIALYKGIERDKKVKRVVYDLHKGSMTAMRWPLRLADGYDAFFGLFQESYPRPFTVAIVMDRLIVVIRLETSWSMMFSDHILLCSESKEQIIELNLEMWRHALEKRGMRVRVRQNIWV